MKMKLFISALAVVFLFCIQAPAGESETIYEYLSSADIPTALPVAKIESVREGMPVEQLRTILGRGYLSPVSGVGWIRWFFADGRALVLSPSVTWSPKTETTFERRSGAITLHWTQGQPPLRITIPPK